MDTLVAFRQGPAMESSNLDGQQMGRKGQETRDRLVEAALDLVKTTPLRDLKSVDIARRAGISPATFYLYFENVQALVLALSDRVGALAEPLVALAEAAWNAEDRAPIEAFVRAYFDFWDLHRPVLRVRNLAAEEGDHRFIESRLRISVPLHSAIGEKVDAAKAAGRIPAGQHTLTLAATLLASMERNASTYLLFTRRFGVSRERLIDSNVFALRNMLFGSQD